MALGSRSPLQPPLAICLGRWDFAQQSWVAAGADQRGQIGPCSPKAELSFLLSPQGWRPQGAQPVTTLCCCAQMLILSRFQLGQEASNIGADSEASGARAEVLPTPVLNPIPVSLSVFLQKLLNSAPGNLSFLSS